MPAWPRMPARLRMPAQQQTALAGQLVLCRGWGLWPAGASLPTPQMAGCEWEGRGASEESKGNVLLIDGPHLHMKLGPLSPAGPARVSQLLRAWQPRRKPRKEKFTSSSGHHNCFNPSVLGLNLACLYSS